MIDRVNIKKQKMNSIKKIVKVSKLSCIHPFINYEESQNLMYRTINFYEVSMTPAHRDKRIRMLPMSQLGNSIICVSLHVINFISGRLHFRSLKAV